MHIAIYDDKHILSQHAAEYIMRIAKDTIDLHGRFTIALTGGTTPGEAYSFLAVSLFEARLTGNVYTYFGEMSDVSLILILKATFTLRRRYFLIEFLFRSHRYIQCLLTSLTGTRLHKPMPLK